MLTNIETGVIISKLSATPREHSSAGRASALQAEGHRFEPCCSHQSRRQRFYAPVAQLVEQRIENPRVVGSTPTGGTTEFFGFRYAGVAHPVERHLAKVEVASSSLVARSNFLFSQECIPKAGYSSCFFVLYTSFFLTSVNAVQRFFCFYLEICGSNQFRCLEFNKIDIVRHFH